MHVLIVAAHHLVLLENHLLMAAAMHRPRWKHRNGSWLAYHAYTRLYLLHILTTEDGRFINKCLLRLHTDLRVVAAT